MELSIAALILVSAALHPVWNLLLKRSGEPQLGYLALTVTLCLAGLTHALLAGSDLTVPRIIWPLIAGSWCGQILYGTCLTATLSRGDLSAYYPIIRSSPVFVVIVSAAFLGQSYASATLVGIAMAIAGGFILLYRRGTHFLHDPKTLGLALLAMSGTGLYSLADARLMQSISPEVMLFWIEGLLIPVYATLYALGTKPGRPPTPAPRVAMKALRLLIPGLIAYTSYYLILMAYQAGAEVAAVTSVRQASIPLSVLLAGLFLREGAILRRLAGAALLALGIVVIVTMG